MSDCGGVASQQADDCFPSAIAAVTSAVLGGRRRA